MNFKEILLILSLNWVLVFTQNYQSVPFSSITTLTFNFGQMTTARRLTPIPQLQCTGGTYGCVNLPNIVQCTNTGSNGVSVQWRCTANLPNGVQFGQTLVSCEGFSSSTDTNVLVGSCGLKYQLDTQAGYVAATKPSYTTQGSSSKVGTIVGAVVGAVVFCGCIVGIIICCCCCACCSSIKDKFTRKNKGDAYQPSGGKVPPPYYPPQQPVYYNNPGHNNNPTHYNNPPQPPTQQGGTHESFAFAQSETR